MFLGCCSPSLYARSSSVEGEVYKLRIRLTNTSSWATCATIRRTICLVSTYNRCIDISHSSRRTSIAELLTEVEVDDEMVFLEELLNVALSIRELSDGASLRVLVSHIPLYRPE